MSTTAVAPLTTEDARLFVTTARRAAEEAEVTVAALDTDGHLIAFHRDDRADAGLQRDQHPQGLLVQLNRPTAELVDAVQPGGLFGTLPKARDRPLLFIAGGFPVHRDGRLIGAIDVGSLVRRLSRRRP